MNIRRLGKSQREWNKYSDEEKNARIEKDMRGGLTSYQHRLGQDTGFKTLKNNALNRIKTGKRTLKERGAGIFSPFIKY